MSWHRVGLEAQVPLRRESSKLQKLRETKPPKESAFSGRVIPHASNVHQHEHGFGHYLAARGNHPNHCAVLKWREHKRMTVRAATPGARFAESYDALRALADSGVVTELVARQVHEHLELVGLLVSAAGVDLHGPWLAASEDGSVGLDWRHGGRRCAITFDRTGTIEFYATDALTEASGSIESVADAIKHVLWLVRPEEAATK
jgi:hypothetical protein